MPSKKLWLPREEPKKPKGYREHRMQSSLTEDQLPGYITRLQKEGAELQSVTCQRGFTSLGMRYTVVYVHDEVLDCEVRT